MENQEQNHKRRVRYQGTHPKTYEEKYKERQPEKYPDTVERVIRKGGTPAGMHIPICVREILEFLQIQPGQTGLDATLGYGGHTVEMLKRLQSQGHLYALDVDSSELAKTRARLEGLGYGPEILTIRQLNFADMERAVCGGDRARSYRISKRGRRSRRQNSLSRSLTARFPSCRRMIAGKRSRSPVREPFKPSESTLTMSSRFSMNLWKSFHGS